MVNTTKGTQKPHFRRNTPTMGFLERLDILSTYYHPRLLLFNGTKRGLGRHLCMRPSVSYQDVELRNGHFFNVDSQSERYGERVPFYADWQRAPTEYVAGNMLKLLPYQGLPMAPNAFYAAVVLADLKDAHGNDRH